LTVDPIRVCTDSRYIMFKEFTFKSEMNQCFWVGVKKVTIIP